MKSDIPATWRLQTHNHGGIRWTIPAGAAGNELRAVLENPDGFLSDPVRQFKDSRNVTVARIPRAGKGGWVLRRLNYGRPLHQVRDSLRSTRARRALVTGLRLAEAGVPTARVLAAGETRRWGWPMRAYLLTEEIPDAVTLQALLQSGDKQRLYSALAHLAESLARLHNAGYSHRDLKASNVLFDGELRAFLIDLDGVRRLRDPARSRAVADLARLAGDLLSTPALPDGAWDSFLQRYCLRRNLTDWQKWREEIARESR